MKVINRIKKQSDISIVTKIEIANVHKNECRLFIETLTKDGEFLVNKIENLTLSEIRRITEPFSNKMKKVANSTFIPSYDTCDYEVSLFINPELMEKERVGFELYGLISKNNANANIVAYYSFAETGSDYRQPILHDEIFGFFACKNFVSSNEEGFFAALDEIGMTCELLDETANNYIFCTTAEYKKQFPEEEEETPRRGRKKKEPEISDVIDSETIKEINNIKEIIKASENSDETKKRGRPSKVTQDVIKEPEVKRGRGRPPKKKEGD